ncbi:hypothetical protein [Gordonia soli]|uniref:HNH endonuclease n=1 Tax=Gordonia soli NBRC 108243 TaxID=1223545 RepID=M0QQR3_9ACTN|nr:hypothetical protein [Gordonia soli]GAC70739.1 hypothetical protein GS4_39_00700 [Gordonia soli NBRC 108243]
MPPRKTTTQRGLGYRHQQQVKSLKSRHIDGTPCWWCGKPMLLAQGLHGDHTIPRKRGGTIADRLLHSWCNEERGDGSRDHLRPALQLQPTDAARKGPTLYLDWP